MIVVVKSNVNCHKQTEDRKFFVTTNLVSIFNIQERKQINVNYMVLKVFLDAVVVHKSAQGIGLALVSLQDRKGD